MSLPTEHNPILARLTSLEARLSSVDEGPDSALTKLEGRSDPDSIRQKLAILIEAERFAEAADFVREKAPHERWCDNAVTALVRNGDIDAAKQIIQWAQSLDDLTTKKRCLVLYAQARIDRALREHPEGQTILPNTLDSQEKHELQDALDILRPVLDLPKANQRIETEIELCAIRLAIRTQALLREGDECRRLGELLTTRTPVPLDLARLMLSHYVPLDESLPTRLRDEHPKSFEAKFLAATIEGQLFKRYRAAFDSALHLVDEATQEGEKEDLCKILLQFAQEMGQEAFDKTHDTAFSLLGENHRFLDLIRATALLRAGNSVEAGPILGNIRNEDDFLWLQVYANYLIQTGDGNSAIDFLLKACEIHRDPHVLKITANLAFRHKRLDVATAALDQSLMLQPNDVETLKNAAYFSVKSQNFTKAAEYYQRLQEVEPHDQQHQLNQAYCLACAGQPEKSLEVYESLCVHSQPPLEAIIGRAELLKSMGQPDDAFASLNEMRADYWDRYEFLVTFMQLAHATNHDCLADEAFIRLRQLHSEGKTEPEVFQEKSFDDVAELMKQHRKHKQLACSDILRGKMPWILADQMLGYPSYWGWWVRTQPFRWFPDDPLFRAEFSLYSTNGFGIREDGNGRPFLMPLTCPGLGTTIAVDLSALITLHSLGLLEKAGDYFKRVLFPSAYLFLLLEESARMVPHQLSQEEGLKRIKIALDEGEIFPLPCANDKDGLSIWYVSEYADKEEEDRHIFRLCDVVSVLRNRGQIGDQKAEQLSTVARQASGVDADHPELAVSNAIQFDLFTFRTLFSEEILEEVLSSFRVYISDRDRNEVLSSLRAISAQEEARKNHADLWSRVRKDPRFVQTPHPVPAEFRSAKQMDDRYVPFVSVMLAEQARVSLFADDRFCQSAFLNKCPDDFPIAFGTDHFLIKLHESGLLGIDRVADAFLQLIARRYRFIIVPPNVLKNLSDRFMTHPPGDPLRKVALYAHDCMRDAGLLSGDEPTTPPISVAHRLFQWWASNIGEFIIDVWADPRYNDDKAEILTRWAIREFLPATPINLRNAEHEIAPLAVRAVLSRALIHSCELRDDIRIEKAMKLMVNELGINDTQYMKIVSEFVNVS